MNQHHQTTYSPRIRARELPMRRFSCLHYDTCLSRAAYSNRTFSCDKCPGTPPAAKPLPELTRVRRKTILEPGRVNTQEAADMLGVGLSMLHKMRYRGEGPPCSQSGKNGTLITYKIEDLQEYIRKRAESRPAPGEEEITSGGASKLMKMSIATLRRFRESGRGPAYRRGVNSCMYKLCDVREYMATQEYKDFLMRKGNRQ